MQSIHVREAVENYKKIQLYSIDHYTIEYSIVRDLEQELEESALYQINERWKVNILSKLVSYLEFGLPYGRYESLFDHVLNLCQVDKTVLENLVYQKAQYVRSSKENLQKIIIWKTTQKQKYKNKGDIIREMLHIIKQKQCGEYLYETDISIYQLAINKANIVLKNLPKEIEYYLI